jgi:CAAX protease family protein
MRFVVDPGLVDLGRPLAWAFLVIICVLLPIGALRQHRRLESGTHPPPRMQLYVSAIITHGALALLVWVVARGQRLNLLPPYRPTAVHVIIGLLALAIGLLPLLERFRLNDAIAEERTRLIAPHRPTEHALFYLVSLTAGIAEELTYRGMLFTLFAAILGSWWVAAIIAAAAFGVAHLFQGWKAVGIAALMGLREQLVVGLTGTLFVAMAVHMLHDAIAGTVIAARARREAAGSR